ncbi:MAG: type II/IV secretion system ATPase subunit [Candidatus Aenigmarchaeota archaeon]|nr:type II/IV secretion system ATPase subunit [Candidatus Aenigmarchaeota archaeon]
MGVIDERDEEQSFMDWFVHGSRKKAEKKKQEKELKQQSQSELDIQKQIEDQIKAQDASQNISTADKQNTPVIVQQAIQPSVQQPASLQQVYQQSKKEEKKIVLKRPSKYPKFVLSRPKLNGISNDAKEATYPLISPYAYAEIKDDGGMLYYKVIEPVIDDEERKALDKLKIALIHFIDIPMTSVKEERELVEFLEEKVQWLLEETDIYVDEKSYTKIMYYLYRDFIGLNSLEPLLRDPYVEDLACDGTGVNIYAIHQRFGTLRTNITFEDEDELKEFVVKLSQRCNRYISYAEPMLDGSLPDGTRVNATLARDVTSRGPTFSIRKFRDKPFSPIEMIGFNTVDSDILAYLWIVIENGSNVLLCGGTGTGKTSLLNSICMFMPEEAKVVSIEDTRELRLNHENWLPAVARIGFGGTKTGEVTMFDLLKESFRQNPNYIIVGEVRGEEAAVMFQAMASGMTAMSTMHAGSADDALKRLQTRPISLPPTLMETLDVLIVMTHAYEKGPAARRIKEMAEIQTVNSDTNKVDINRVFTWDPANDKYNHNEAKMLKEIAMKKGYSEKYIMQELENRKKVIEWLSNKQLDWKTVTDYFTEYRRNKDKVMKIISGQAQELGEEPLNKKTEVVSEPTQEKEQKQNTKIETQEKKAGNEMNIQAVS